MSIKYKYGIFTLTAFALILGVVAGHQLMGESRDYENYLIFFDWVNTQSIGNALEYRFEPGFVLLSYLLSYLVSSGAATYATITGICIAIKIYGVIQLKNFGLVIFVFLVFYLSRYFILFEMTVLRVALAASFAFFVFLHREVGRIRLKDIIFLGLAVSMHYSAILFVLIYFFQPKTRIVIILSWLFVYLLAISTKGILINILPEILFVFSTYENFNDASLIPKPMILDFIFLCFMMFYWRYADEQMRIAIFGIGLGFSLHFSLLEFSLIAGRFRELISIFFIVYVVRSFHRETTILRIGSSIFLLLSGSMHIYVYYIHDPLLT